MLYLDMNRGMSTMRGTPFIKGYPGHLRNIWDRFDLLPFEFRQMVANDPDGCSLSTLEAAEELAREAGLLPLLPGEKEPDKKELRAERDRKRTKEAQARSRVVYKIPAGTMITRNPPPGAKKVVVVVEKPEKSEPTSKSEHNS